MKPLILPAIGYLASLQFFSKDGFGIKYPSKVDMPLNKETKLSSILVLFLVAVISLSLLFFAVISLSLLFFAVISLSLLFFYVVFEMS